MQLQVTAYTPQHQRYQKTLDFVIPQVAIWTFIYITTIKRCWFLLHPTVGCRHILEIARILSRIPGALQWMWRGGGTIGDQTGWASCFGTIEADPSRAGQGDNGQQIARDLRCFFKKGCWFTPWKISFSIGWFLGSMLIFRGVLRESCPQNGGIFAEFCFLVSLQSWFTVAMSRCLAKKMLGWICACASNSWEDYFNQLILFCRKSQLFSENSRDQHENHTQGPLNKMPKNLPFQSFHFPRGHFVWNSNERMKPPWVYPYETSGFDIGLEDENYQKSFSTNSMVSSPWRDGRMEYPQISRAPVMKLQHQQGTKSHRSQIKTWKPCSVHYKKSPRPPLKKLGISGRRSGIDTRNCLYNWVCLKNREDPPIRHTHTNWEWFNTNNHTKIGCIPSVSLQIIWEWLRDWWILRWFLATSVMFGAEASNYRLHLFSEGGNVLPQQSVTIVLYVLVIVSSLLRNSAPGKKLRAKKSHEYKDCCELFSLTFFLQTCSEPWLPTADLPGVSVGITISAMEWPQLDWQDWTQWPSILQNERKQNRINNLWINKSFKLY